jgi:hypothetical protein
MSCIQSLQKLTVEIEKNMKSNDAKWIKKVDKLKQKNKLLKSRSKDVKALAASLIKENERLWTIILNNQSLVAPPKSKAIDLTVDTTMDECDTKIKKEIPCVTPPEKVEEPIVSTDKQEPNKLTLEPVSDIEEAVEEETEEDVVEEEEVVVEEEVVEEEVVEEEVVEEEVVEEEVVEETEEEEVVEEEVVEEEVVEEEVVEEEVVEEEEVVVEETEEEKTETEVVADDDNEEEVFEIEIDGTSYYTTNETSGMIYAKTEDGDIGDEVGYFEDGEPGFYE